MSSIVLSPIHPDFPQNPPLSPDQLAEERAARTGYLWARLRELEGDCRIGRFSPETGEVTVQFFAMDSALLVEKLAQEKEIYAQLEGDFLRFTLSPVQAYEPLDTVQGALMELLNLS